MNKLTRRFKKKRKNKTFKGGSDTEADRPINVEPLKDGVHAVGNVVESVNNTVGNGVGWVKDTASEAVVGTTNFFADKANDLGNSLIGAIANKVQANMPHGISEQGLDIIEKNSDKFIEAGSDIAKKALDQTTEIIKEKLPDIANAAGTAGAAAFETIPFVGAFAAAGTALNKATDATEKSLDMFNQIQDVVADAVDTAQETIKEVKGDVSIPDVSIPDVGALSNNAIGEANKQINNVQQSLSKASELAASKASEASELAASKASELAASKANYFPNPGAPVPAAGGGGFKNLTKQKAQIGGRINDSIAAFTDPIGYQSSILKGGNNNKTKRLVKRNKKSRSRRVRFSF
jgi:hypothetical protein